jgi:putative ATPase
MEPDGLFDLDEAPQAAPPVEPPPASAPLAVRMRPRTLDVAGHAVSVDPGSLTRR